MKGSETLADKKLDKSLDKSLTRKLVDDDTQEGGQESQQESQQEPQELDRQEPQELEQSRLRWFKERNIIVRIGDDIGCALTVEMLTRDRRGSSLR